MNSKTEKVEGLIIQGLAHVERRNILKIVSLTEGGAIYSDILGELGLNKGKMNYHLRQLDGLVEKNGEMRYHLTPLGKRALIVLNSMTEDLEDGYERFLNAARPDESNLISTFVSRFFYVIALFTLSAFIFLANLVRMEILVGDWPRASYYYLAGFGLLVVGLVWFKGWVIREADRASDWWI